MTSSPHSSQDVAAIRMALTTKVSAPMVASAVGALNRLEEQLEAAHEALEHIVSMTPSGNFIETAKSWASKGLNPATGEES